MSRRILWLLLVGLVVFNAWHATYRGIWDPISAIDSLGLSRERAEALQSVDPNLRPARRVYDGQYFYVMTLDPLLESREWLELIDQPAYRYRRMLLPLLAHVTALGYVPAFPYTLLGLNIAFFGLGAWVISRMARPFHWSRWVVAGYFVNTGLVYSVFRTLPEPVALSLCLAGIHAWRRRHAALGAGCFALAILAREHYILVPLAVATWESLFEKRPAWRSAALSIAAALPFVLWVAFVHARIPAGEAVHDRLPALLESPGSLGVGRFSLPFVGFVRETIYGIRHATTSTEFNRTVSLPVVTLLIAPFVTIGFLRKHSFWGFLGLSQLAFAFVLRGDIWNYHAGSARVLILVFLFVMIWCADELASPVS